MGLGRINDLHEKKVCATEGLRYVMCIFSFHLSDSFQELGISPNLDGFLPIGQAGAPPQWQTLDGIKALSHAQAGPNPRLPVPAAVPAAPEPTGNALGGHILAGSALMELRNADVRSGEEAEKQRYLLKAKYSSYWEIQTWGGKKSLFKWQQKLLVLQGHVCP